MFPRKGKNLLKLWCLTKINHATGWFKTTQIPKKTAAEIVDITKKTWFTHYPLQQQDLFDRGTKSMDEFYKMCQNDYGLKRKHITTRNLHYSSIIKKSIKLLQISSENLMCLTSLTTFHGEAS